jgi:hypothetical protein
VGIKNIQAGNLVLYDDSIKKDQLGVGLVLSVKQLRYNFDNTKVTVVNIFWNLTGQESTHFKQEVKLYEVCGIHS